jgi:integrase/recombinase XerC
VEQPEWVEAICLYETYQRRRGRAVESIKTRGRILAQLARWAPDPWSVTPDDLDDWLDDPAKSMDTRRCYLSGVAGFYRWAMRAGFALYNPVDKVERPRRKRRLPRPIDVDHLGTALTAADPLMRTWLLLGSRAGLRCHEIAGLDRSDIFDSGTHPAIWVRHGKGDKERVVPMHPEITLALKTLGMPAVGPLFPDADGERLSPNAVSKRINKHLRRLDIRATSHQLRHRFGTDVYQQSMDLRLTQELLGHSSPETTAGYAAWSQDHALAVVRSLPPVRAAEVEPAPIDVESDAA